MSGNLFDALQDAITQGDLVGAQRIQAKILRGSRDTSLDENLLDSIKGKVLYKSILKIISDTPDLSISWYIKVISSLLTHNVIESEVTKNSLNSYPIKELYVVLGNLISSKEGAVDDAKVFIKDRYGELIKM